MDVMNFLSKVNIDTILQALTENKGKVLAAGTALLYAAYFFKRPRNLPPGPLGYPYIGSIRELSGDISNDFRRLAKKYGDLFCLWMGGERYVVVFNSYDVIKEAYVTRGSDFADREPGYSLGDFDVLEPLFNAHYDEDQKASRKITVKFFRKFVSTKMEEVLSDEISKLGAVADSYKGRPIEMSKPLESILANMFCAVHFNTTYPFGDPELETIIQGVDDWYVAFEDAYKICFMGHTMLRKTPMSGSERIKAYSNYVKQQIKDHVATLDSKHPRDMIDTLLIEDALNRFGMENFANLIIELVPNGVYTASIALVWMLHYLENNPKYQDEMLQEITSLKGTSKVTIEDRPNLPLTEAFVIETLRMSTPLQISMINKPSHATKLRGYYIPENVTIVSNYAAVHADPVLFPQPETFRPERFIKEDGKLHIGEGFVPFGMGRRVCVAEQLMRNSLFYIWASMIQQFKISPTKKKVQGIIANNLISKITNYQVYLERRL